MTTKEVENKLEQLAREITNISYKISDLEDERDELEAECEKLGRFLYVKEIPSKEYEIFNLFKELMIFSKMTVFEIRYYLLERYPEKEELIFTGI
jgi:predicted RNase H-like nuclease (RuvC/YqgF family)